MGSSHHAEYDENLLASAPAPTKELLQGGYTTDLLEKTAPTPSRRERQRDVEAGSTQGSDKPIAAAPLTPAKIPFYRTRKGIIIIVIAAIVIIAAVVGGAVGGSKKGSKAVNTTTPPPSNSSTTDSGQGGGVLSSSSDSQGGGTQGPSPSVTNGPTATVGPPGGTSTPPPPVGLPTGGILTSTAPQPTQPVQSPAPQESPTGQSNAAAVGPGR